MIGYDAKNAFEGIQMNFVFSTSLKYHTKIFHMLGSLLVMGREVIQVSKDEIGKIMKRIGHFPLESGSNIF
jgi:hypothetical protein